MKIPLVGSVSKETKQTLMGGVLGGIIVGAEQASNSFMVGYPQDLKNRSLPLPVPRNGALIVDIAPMGVAWVVTKKKHSLKMKNIASGLMIYDLPKLVGQLITNSASMMTGGAGVFRMSMPMRVVAVNNNFGLVRQNYAPVGRGKYSTVSPNNSFASSSGRGRYSTG